MLEGQFSSANDAESLKILWAYSADSRLIDVMLLDQHVRRCQGEDGTVAQPAGSGLLRRRAGVELPNDRGDPTPGCRGLAGDGEGRGPDSSVLELVLAVAAGIFRTYDQLMTEVVSIEDAVEQASQLPVVEDPLQPDAAEMGAEPDRVMKMVLDSPSR